MIRKLRERVSVFSAKNPSQTILVGILILNVLLFLIAAFIISALTPSANKQNGFWTSVFYTVSMVLDAGCMEYVIKDIGEASVALILVCIGTVLIGMITFTGAVVGYVTNVISNFISNSKSGNRALKVSGHTVMLNWNSRASEIVNDLLYTGKKEIVVILAGQNGTEIEREIGERLAATIRNENKLLKVECRNKKGVEKISYYLTHKLKNRVTVIVREGETYSTKQLMDISISQAETVIILTKEYQNSVCKFEHDERRNEIEKGNSNTVKTLVQVAEMTSSEESADAQTIIVEVEDNWTAMLVERIVAHKEKIAKCRIIPIYVNKVLGQILSQFSIMPELNTVYSELFSNRGAEFFYKKSEWVDNVDKATEAYMKTHAHAIPLTIMKTASGNHAYTVANFEEDCERVCPASDNNFSVKLNYDYELRPRNIVIIGHNSKCESIMNGFNAFRGEHGSKEKEILNITVIDDQKSLEKVDYYRAYPYVKKTVAADIFDAKLIKNTIKEAIDSFENDTSLLILSDDHTIAENIDAAALTYLIYVQDIISEREALDPSFRRESIDVVVEILNPKNYDVVHNYSADNVVISNRYISKMVTQIGRKQALFEFYSDILTYDEEGAASYNSKELYVKEVDTFFDTIPSECTARQLIRSVYEASPETNKTMVLGVATASGKMMLFTGDQDSLKVSLSPNDKLIVFSNH